MKERKKVLLITYYWPPSGGAGVHRWLRFSKFFHENDIDLTVYCPESAAWPVFDEGLLNEVDPSISELRRPIFEPHKYLSGGGPGVGLSEKKKRNLIKKMIVWVRGNMFIPDSRAFWIKPSIRFLSKHLSEHPDYDAIISTGPPHSTHMIAMGLKEKFNIKWIADFRDPWTQIDFYEDLNIGKRADRIQHKLEEKVLKSANEVVTVSHSCAEGLEAISGKKVHVITNGYTFPEFDAVHLDGSGDFMITHFGSMPSSRNPKVLWQVIKELSDENELFRQKLKIQLIGTVDISIVNSIREAGLEHFVSYLDPIPHAESIAMQRSTPILLLIANTTGNVKGILTGKFFEYLGAKRPILAIGATGSDLETAMNVTRAGYFATSNTPDALKAYLSSAFAQFIDGQLNSTAENLDQFSSRKLAADFCNLI